MPDPTPPPPLASPENPQKATPLKCLIGSFVAGSLALLLYRLTAAIAGSFALHPISNKSQIAHSLSVAVRTLVVGMSTMATGIFSIAALGLIGLGIQLLLQGGKRSPLPPTD
jgi:Protein of unknown function (DUF3082)